MLPKVKRIQNPKAIEACKKDCCEVCYHRAYGDPHHIMTRGAGGPDHPYNLIQLCWTCHYGKVPSGELSKDKLFFIVSKREGVSVESIKDALYRMKRGEHVEGIC